MRAVGVAAATAVGGTTMAVGDIHACIIDGNGRDGGVGHIISIIAFPGLGASRRERGEKSGVVMLVHPAHWRHLFWTFPGTFFCWFRQHPEVSGGPILLTVYQYYLDAG